MAGYGYQYVRDAKGLQIRIEDPQGRWVGYAPEGYSVTNRIAKMCALANKGLGLTSVQKEEQEMVTKPVEFEVGKIYMTVSGDSAEVIAILKREIPKEGSLVVRVGDEILVYNKDGTHKFNYMNLKSDPRYCIETHTQDCVSIMNRETGVEVAVFVNAASLDMLEELVLEANRGADHKKVKAAPHSQP